MVKEKRFEGKIIFVCEVCGLGYLEKEDAQKCENWCKKNPRTCNLQISQKAIYPPIIPTSRPEPKTGRSFQAEK